MNTALYLTNTVAANNDNTAGAIDDCAAVNFIAGAGNLMESSSGCGTPVSTADPTLGTLENTNLGGT